MLDLSAKSKQAVSRTLNAEATRANLIMRLEMKHRRTSSAGFSGKASEPTTKQQLLKRYEDKVRQIQTKKTLADEAERAKAREWRRLLRLESHRDEVRSESGKHKQKLREVKSAREQRRFKSWRDRVEAEEIEEVECRKQNYEEKMSGHSSRYGQSVRSLSAKTSDRLKKIQEVTVAQQQQRQDDAEALLRRFLEKQSQSQAKRRKISSQLNSRKVEKHRLLNDKLTKVKLKAEQAKREVEDRAHSLEVKERTTNQLINKRSTDWRKNLELRVEMHKLKTKDSNDLGLRKKRIANTRRLQILSRHLDDQQRIDTLLRERQHAALLKRDLEIKAMIERERVRETLKHIVKSPDTIRSKSLVRSYAESV